MLNIYNDLLAANKITRDQYDSELKLYNAGTIDAVTKGWETEFVANPTKTLTLRLGVSYSNRIRTNFFSEIYGYFAANEPEGAVYDRKKSGDAYVRRAYPLYRPFHVRRAMAMILKAVGLTPQGRLNTIMTRLGLW